MHETARDTGELAEPELPEPPPRLTDAAVHERFNLHASVHLAAHDDLGRERLCRYLARPAFSLARFGVRRDGLVVYRVKNAGRGRVKQRVMTPVECLARLAAMVPPPRYPLLRLPRHRWRDRVVPRPPESHAGCMKSLRKQDARRGDEPRPCGSPSAARVEPGAVGLLSDVGVERIRLRAGPACARRAREAAGGGVACDRGGELGVWRRSARPSRC